MEELIRVNIGHLNINELHYLSHPFTTFGKQLENLHNALFIEKQLLKEGIKVINPIKLPLGSTNDEAMEACYNLYKACKVLIFCENWDKSSGCQDEFLWTVRDGKAAYYFDGKYLYIMSDTFKSKMYKEIKEQAKCS